MRLKQSTKKRLVDILVFLFLLCISYVFLFPILKMISMCFMSPKDIMDPSVSWIPKHPSLNNISVAIKVLNIPFSLLMSIGYASIFAACQTIVACLAGFAFARFEFKFKNFWFIMLLVSFIMPLPVMLVPRLMIFVSVQETIGIQMIGTIWPQLAFSMLGQGVNSTVLVLISYNFIKMIPYSLDEAAMIDGASTRQVFIHIILKLSMTTILVVFLFSFVWNWNETNQTSTFLRSSDLLPLRLAMFDSLFESAMAKGAQMRLNEAFKMTATLISILPLLMLYAGVQKYFIKGIENTGITGE